MMGTKDRGFSPLPRGVCLEDLVPRDHFSLATPRPSEAIFLRGRDGLYGSRAAPKVAGHV